MKPAIKDSSDNQVNKEVMQTSTCGSSLSLTILSSEIEYNEFEPVAQDERCIWTIQRVNYKSASVNRYSGNSSPEAGSLLITGIATAGSSIMPRCKEIQLEVFISSTLARLFVFIQQCRR